MTIGTFRGGAEEAKKHAVSAQEHSEQAGRKHTKTAHQFRRVVRWTAVLARACSGSVRSTQEGRSESARRDPSDQPVKAEAYRCYKRCERDDQADDEQCVLTARRPLLIGCCQHMASQ